MNAYPHLTAEEGEAVRALGRLEAPPLPTLLTDEVLSETGLAPADPRASKMKFNLSALASQAGKRKAPASGPAADPKRIRRAPQTRQGRPQSPISIDRTAGASRQAPPSPGVEVISPLRAAAPEAVVAQPAQRAVRPSPGPQAVRGVQLRRSAPAPDHSTSGESSGPTPSTQPDRVCIETPFTAESSALSSAAVAREFARAMRLPADVAQMGRLKLDQYVDQMFLTVVRVSASYLGRIVMLSGLDLTCLSSQHLHEAVTTHDLVTGYERDRKAHLKEIRSLGDKVNSAEERLVKLRAELEEARRRTGAAEKIALEAEAKAEASEKARAEGEALLDRVKEDLGALKGELQTVREESSQELSRVLDAFRSSSEYQLELEEGATDAYIKGFENCRRQVQRLHPGLDVDSLDPAAVESESDAEEPVPAVGSAPVADEGVPDAAEHNP